MKRVLLATAGALALYGCGGGNEPTAAQVSGRIADGYIRGATVFWDCNGNMTLDSSEPSVISGDGGRYTISSSPIAVAPLTACVLRAVIPSNAIDEDDGKPVGDSYMMAAVPGNPEFISPLTTLVSYGAFTEDELRSEFELGSKFSTAADYIAAKSEGAKSHTLAKFVALGLQAVDGVISTGVSSVHTATIRGMVVDIPRDVVSLGTVSAEQLRSHRDNKLPDFSEYSEFSVALATGEFYIDQAAIDAQPNPKEARRLVDLAYAAIQRHPMSRAGASINWQVIPYEERTKFSSELSNPSIFHEADGVGEIKSQLSLRRAELNEELELMKSANSSEVGWTIAKGTLDQAIYAAENLAKIATGPASAPVYLVKGQDAAKIAKAIAYVKKYAGCATVGSKLVYSQMLVSGDSYSNSDFIEIFGCVANAMNAPDGVINAISSAKSGAQLAEAKVAFEAVKAIYDTAASLADMTGFGHVSGAFNLTLGTALNVYSSYLKTNEIRDAAWKVYLDKTEELVHRFHKDYVAEASRNILAARLSRFIKAKPVFDFSLVNSVTVGVPFGLEVKGAASNGVRYQLDFGDGSPLVESNAPGAFTHVYSTYGSYTLKITLTSGGFDAQSAPLSELILYRTISATCQAGQTVGPEGDCTQPISDWLSWDGESWTKTSVTTVDGGITNAREFGGLIYKLPTPVDGDNSVFEVKARFNPSMLAYSGKDIAISLDNRFGSGEVDSANQPKVTRSVQANFRTNGWSDIVAVNSDAGPFRRFIGTTNTLEWHVYKVETYNGVVNVYVDGVLKYTHSYSGRVGALDTFSAAGLAGVAIDPASLKVSKFK